MKHEELQEVGPEVIARNRYPPKEDHRYGPSQISGCPLSVFLDHMADVEFETNSYTFGGTAVHYYLQESGILTEALSEAGYHPAFIDYEVTEEYEISDGVYIHGSCDVLCEDDEDQVIYDIKFSSIPSHSGHGRIYKYMSQANTYAQMHDADGYGLIMISSKSSDPLENNITILEGQMSDDNWGIVKEKTISIDNALEDFGYFDGERWTIEGLGERDVDFWKEVMSHFDSTHIPSYEKECRYCEHSEYCPEKNGKLGGLKSMVD